MNNLNKYLAQLADLEWSKVLIGSIVLSALYFFLMFDSGASLVEEVKNLRSALEESQRQLKQTQQAMEDAKRFEERVKLQQSEFLTIVQFMPTDFKSADLVSIIGRQASLAGVRVTKLDPLVGDVRKDFYEMTRTNLALEGSFAQIVTFLSYLSQVRRLLTFESVELTARSGPGAPGIATEGGAPNSTLSFTGTLVGYRYVKPVEAVKASPTPAPGGK